MDRLAICAIFKNEGPYILEWIAFHKCIGFDHFFLYDNDSEDNGVELIKESTFSNIVTIINWPERPGQKLAYRHFIQNFAHAIDWVAFIDLDEFILPLKNKSIRELLPRYKEFSAVLINWRNFGPNDFEFRANGLVIENYLRRLADGFQVNLHIKTLAKAKDLLDIGPNPHTFEVKGDCCDPLGRKIEMQAIQPSGCFEDIVINHYFTKSREDWNNKLKRKKADLPDDSPAQYENSIFDFFKENSDVLDTLIKKFVPKIKNQLSNSLYQPRNCNAVMRPDNYIVFHNSSGGHWANLMIKYIVAKKFQSLIPSKRVLLSNFIIEAWNISHNKVEPKANSKIFSIKYEQHVDFTRLVYLSEQGIFDYIDFRGYGQRMENFPKLEISRGLFIGNENIGIEFGAQYLVCPIRGAEIFRAEHSGYTLIPINFYRDIFRGRKLIPVFMGQITDNNQYIASLKGEFKNAIFLNSGGPVFDFETIRKSKNILIPVSAFAWLASWLSNADRIIMPVYGLFNRDQFPQNDLLPLGDPRYEFYKFPVHRAVPIDRIVESHAQIDGEWHRVSPSELACHEEADLVMV